MFSLANPGFNTNMKLSFSTLLLAVGLVLGHPQRKVARGQDYTHCVEDYLSEGVELATSRVPDATNCTNEFKNNILQSVPQYTDYPRNDRRKHFLEAFARQGSELQGCLKGQGVSPDDIPVVAKSLKETGERITNKDDSIECYDHQR